MRLNLIFLLLYISGCAPFANTAKYSIDPALVPMAAEFFKAASKHGISPDISWGLTIEFVNEFDDDTTVGMCRDTVNGPKVQILRPYWSAANSVVKEQLMFHELGHCLLGRHHDDNMIVDHNEAIEKSLMTPWMIDDTVYLRHEEYYLKELFGK